MTSTLPGLTRPRGGVRPSGGGLGILAGAAANQKGRPLANRRRSAWRRLDWVLTGTTLALCAIGTLLVTSATRQAQQDHGLDPYSYLKKELLNVAIGIGIAVLVMRSDYRAVRAYAPVFYVASLLGLLAVLVVGSTINGAKSWLVLPFGFQLEPSEFAKVALVAGLALILGEKRDDRREGVTSTPTGRDVLLVLGVAALPLGLIMLEPDLGVSLVLVALVLGMLAVSGAPARWVVSIVVAGVAFGAAVIGFHLLKPYQEARLTEFVKQGKGATSAAGYNVHQALVANAHGGLFGRGLFHGSQTQGQFVPEQKTDFVFTVAGEELGFVGCAVILVLFGLLLWRTLSIGQRSRDRFGTLLCVGVVCWFAFQIFVNVGMTLGIMPVTGLPLPFLSYGGSAMFANMAAVGLVQSVRLRTVR